MKDQGSPTRTYPGGVKPRAAPVFVVGANRSGTTLLRLLLNAHSHIAIPEELTYFNGVIAGVPLHAWRTPGMTPDQYCMFVRGFLHRHADTLAPLQLGDLEAEILSHPEMDLRRPYQMALEAWARCHGKTRWGEKTPGNLFYAREILDMFPGARFIYLVRDPRAGVLSMMRAHMFVEDVVINALNRHRYATQGWTRLVQAVPPGQRMTLRYEDLVAAPEATARALCAFLDEPFEPGMLHFYEDAPQYMTPRAVTDFNRSATRPITTARVDGWRDQLRPVDVVLIESICVREMDRFGYERETEATPSPSQRLDVLVKRSYLKMQCWRHPNAPQYLLKHRLFDRTRRRLRRAGKHLTPWSRSAREAEPA